MQTATATTQQPTQPFEVPTAAEARGYGASLGLTDGALDAYVKASAAFRHASRVRATIDCARHIVAISEIEVDHRDQDLYDLMVLAVLTLELRGIGGPGGYGHPSTAHGGLGATRRLLPFLGSGRWHANDGDAWRAAAAEAITIVNSTAVWREAPSHELRFSFYQSGAVVISLGEIMTSLPAALIDRCQGWLAAEAKRTLRDALAKLPQQGNYDVDDQSMPAEDKQTLVEIANGASAFAAACARTEIHLAEVTA